MHGPYALSLHAEAVVLVPGLALAYGLAARRYPAPGWRVGAFAAGLGIILVAFVSPLETLALHYLLTAHLLQNVVLAEWAPALCVLGLPPALAAALGRRRVERAPRLWGLSAIGDQQLAGITMAVEQALVFFVLFAVYFLRFMQEEDGTVPAIR